MDSICILSFRTNLPAIRYFSVRRIGFLPIINGILHDSLYFCPLVYYRRFSSRDYQYGESTSFLPARKRKREHVLWIYLPLSFLLRSPIRTFVSETAWISCVARTSRLSVSYLTVSPADLFTLSFSAVRPNLGSQNCIKGIARFVSSFDIIPCAHLHV